MGALCHKSQNFITQFGEKIYEEKTGIVTGENHSVYVTHFIIEQINENLKGLNYLDDTTIIFIFFPSDPSNTKSR